MKDLDELYQTLILEQNRPPRNFRSIQNATVEAEGRSPLCGDAFNVWVRLDGETIADVSFLGRGCAISKASASMMTAAVRGKSIGEARALFERFREVVTGKALMDEPARAEARKLLGCLSAFSGVSAYPVRVKCATLAWHAMRAALEGGAKSQE